MATYEKLQRTFVKDEAYIVLRDWIIEGKLEPGQKLKDKELAERLGVSRTPIREALLRLENEGFVLTNPNRFTQVSPIDIQDASHLYSIVWSLEKLAMEQAFEQIRKEDLEAMGEANEKLLKALKKHQSLAALEADDLFHGVYIHLSGNQELQHILFGLKHKLKRLELYYFEQTKEVQHSHEEHLQIIKALKKHDLASTLSAIENNWKASFERLRRF